MDSVSSGSWRQCYTPTPWHSVSTYIFSISRITSGILAQRIAIALGSMSPDGSVDGVAFATHPELDRNAVRSAALCTHCVNSRTWRNTFDRAHAIVGPAPVSEIRGSWVNSFPARVLTVPAGSSIKRERGQRLLSIRRESRQPISEIEPRFLAALLTRVKSVAWD